MKYRTLVERLLNEEESGGFVEVTNAIKEDRSLLRHFATLHDAYYRGDTSLSSKEAKTAMGALLGAMWGKVTGVQALGTMEPQPNVTEFIRMLDEVGEGPLGAFFGFRSPQDIPGGGETGEPSHDVPNHVQNPSDEEIDLDHQDQNFKDQETEDREWTPIKP